MQELFKDVSPTRRRILVSAVNVFSAKGYRTSNVDQIARGAKIAKGTIYYHFKSKEDILNDLVELAIKYFMTEIAKKVATGKSSEERIRFLIKAQCDLDDKYPEINQVITLNYFFLDRVWRNLRDQRVSFGDRIIDACKKDGTCSEDLNSRIVAMILHFFILTCNMISTVLTNVPRKEIYKELEKVVVKGLKK